MVGSFLASFTKRGMSPIPELNLEPRAPLEALFHARKLLMVQQAGDPYRSQKKKGSWNQLENETVASQLQEVAVVSKNAVATDFISFLAPDFICNKKG